MLEKLFHLLTGYAEFLILGDQDRGDPARFLNLAARSGFGFWGFGKREGLPFAQCRAGEYKKLRPLARRCHVRLRCVRKRGVPFYTARLWDRKGLIAGLVCGAALYFFLSGFVWNISVTGTETLGDSRVLAAARSGGLYQGAAQSGFVPKLTAQHIVACLPELKWAVVNTDGCFVEIGVGEAAQKPEITDDSRWSNIVASRAGTVLKVEAERGRPEVAQGDTVEEGDLLISGLYRERTDPYGPQPLQPQVTLGAARGSVTGETYREFTVQVSAVKKKPVPTGKVQVNRALTLFGIRIPLGLNTKPRENCRVYRKKSVLTALGTELPLSMEQDIYVFLEEKEESLEEEKLKEAALLKLREAQKAAIASGGRVLEEELTYAFPEGMCILSAKCRCEEEIGKVQEILEK